jgi:hypothetical protein
MNLATIPISDLMNPKVKTVNEDKNIMSACKEYKITILDV